MHTEANLVVVGGLRGRFEACVRIAADFPQQWPQKDLPWSEPLLAIQSVLPGCLSTVSLLD